MAILSQRSTASTNSVSQNTRDQEAPVLFIFFGSLALTIVIFSIQEATLLLHWWSGLDTTRKGWQPDNDKVWRVIQQSTDKHDAVKSVSVSSKENLGRFNICFNWNAEYKAHFKFLSTSDKLDPSSKRTMTSVRYIAVYQQSLTTKDIVITLT